MNRVRIKHENEDVFFVVFDEKFQLFERFQHVLGNNLLRHRIVGSVAFSQSHV